MKKPAQALCVGLMLSWAFASPVVAQTTETDTITPLSSGQAADLRVLPRIGAGFTTTGAGYQEPFFSLEGFAPLQQTPGSSLTFLEGKLLFLTDSTFGTNLILGQRFYSPSQNRILGGYISYDVRDTGNNVFHQIGAGFERLGDDWDLRVNAYLPVGNTREQVSESVSNLFFQENFLVLNRTRQFEAAMAGFDVEAGGRLLRLGDGDLRGYAGVYYYGAEGSDNGFGVRGRLEARPSDNLRLGLSVQHDPVFDTRVVLNLGVSFPGTRPRGVERGSVLARMGESVGRTATITVDEQTEDATVVATNPKTGAPWQFRHVNLGIGTGNGTFENPTGTVEDALNVAQSDDIVYVQPGTNPEIPSFTIPDTVAVLSVAPPQTINTVEFSTVQLPLSGSGVFPKIAGTVTMGNDTTLSGFAIRGETGPGIEARGISNAVIRDNKITSSSEAGVFLRNTTGTLTLTNNTIAGNGVASLVGRNINNIAIANSRLTSRNSTTNGIFLNGVSGTAEISNSQIKITNSTEEGISVANVTGSLNLAADGKISDAGGFGVSLSNSTGAIALSGFEITNSGKSGITGTNINNAEIRDNRISNSTEQGIILTEVRGSNAIANNTITNSGLAGLFVQGSSNKQELTLNDNTIRNSGSQGVFIQAAENAQQKVTASGNTVSGSNGQGVFVQASGTARQEVAISDSTVNKTNVSSDGIGGQGIFVQVAERARQNFTANGTQVSNSAGQGVFVQASGSTSRQQFTATNNTVSNSNGQGVFVQASGTTQQQFSIENSQVNSTKVDSDGAGGQGIFVQAAEGAQQNFTANGNQVSNSAGQGVFVQASGTTSQQQFNASNNRVSNSTGQGVFVQAFGTTRQQFSIDNSQVNNTKAGSDGGGGQGIFVQAAEDARQNFTANDNKVSNSAGQGVFVQASGNNRQRFTANGNQVSNSRGQGIFVQASGMTRQQFSIENTQVNRTKPGSDGAGGQGIFVQAAEDAQQNFTINDNKVSNSAEQGIFIQASGGTQQFTANGNKVSNSADQGIFVQASGNTQQEFTINDSRISLSGGQGIFIQTAQDAQQQFNIRNNAIANSTLEGIFIQSSQDAQISANIQFNILKDNRTPGFAALMNSNQNFCLGLNRNNSNTDFLLQRNSGTFQLINLNNVSTRNTGTINFEGGVGNFENVKACP